MSGVDLTGALVEVARSGTAATQPPGNPGARTYQALLAILGDTGDWGAVGGFSSAYNGLSAQISTPRAIQFGLRVSF